MGECSEAALGEAGGGGACGEGRAEAAFVLRDDAFGVGPAAVEAVRKLVIQPAAVGALGFALMRAARVDRDDDGRDAERFATDAMMRLDVVGPVAVEPIDRQVLDGLRDGGQKRGRVLAGAGAQRHRGDEVAVVMTDEGDLGKSPVSPRAAGDGEIVPTDVMTLETGGVDGGLGPRVDQAALRGEAENRPPESIESPFFNSRAWAFWSVV